MHSFFHIQKHAWYKFHVSAAWHELMDKASVAGEMRA